jgi:hypothetical protein
MANRAIAAFGVIATLAAGLMLTGAQSAKAQDDSLATLLGDTPSPAEVDAELAKLGSQQQVIVNVFQARADYDTAVAERDAAKQRYDAKRTQAENACLAAGSGFQTCKEQVVKKFPQYGPDSTFANVNQADPSAYDYLNAANHAGISKLGLDAAARDMKRWEYFTNLKAAMPRIQAEQKEEDRTSAQQAAKKIEQEQQQRAEQQKKQDAENLAALAAVVKQEEAELRQEQLQVIKDLLTEIQRQEWPDPDREALLQAVQGAVDSDKASQTAKLKQLKDDVAKRPAKPRVARDSDPPPRSVVRREPQQAQGQGGSEAAAAMMMMGVGMGMAMSNRGGSSYSSGYSHQSGGPIMMAPGY